MPLLEINQSRHVCASVRLDEVTAAQVDQYAAFIRGRCCGQGAQLCLLKGPRLPGLPEDATRQAGCPRFACAKRPEQWCDGAADKEACSRGRAHGFCARSEGMIVHSISWRCKNGASHRENFDTPPLRGNCKCTTVHLQRFQRHNNFRCTWVHLGIRGGYGNFERQEKRAL